MTARNRITRAKILARYFMLCCIGRTPHSTHVSFTDIISLMRGKRKANATDLSAASVRRQPNPRQRILVVEDDSEIRQVNTEVLIYSGYQVDAAEDGAAAWDALQLEHYDLLVTDNHMPRVTGVELLEKILSANLPLPVIMATGEFPQDEFTRCPWLRPNIILLKPYSFDELLAAVKEVLRVTSDARKEIASPPNWRISPPAHGYQI
jgi:CheY-like chemotaxis protein